MKHFFIYTALRIALFLACWGVLAAIGVMIFDDDKAVGMWSFIGGAVISSILSLKLLEGPRERFAQSVQNRAQRATDRFEELKTSEDED